MGKRKIPTFLPMSFLLAREGGTPCRADTPEGSSRCQLLTSTQELGAGGRARRNQDIQNTSRWGNKATKEIELKTRVFFFFLLPFKVERNTALLWKWGQDERVHPYGAQSLSQDTLEGQHNHCLPELVGYLNRF